MSHRVLIKERSHIGVSMFKAAIGPRRGHIPLARENIIGVSPGVGDRPVRWAKAVPNFKGVPRPFECGPVATTAASL